MVKFGPLAADIFSLVWGTPGNFNWFRVLAALLSGTLVVGVSQTLRRWTEGATYIRQGGHRAWHWLTLQLLNFCTSGVQISTQTARKTVHFRIPLWEVAKSELLMLAAIPYWDFPSWLFLSQYILSQTVKVNISPKWVYAHFSKYNQRFHVPRSAINRNFAIIPSINFWVMLLTGTHARTHMHLWFNSNFPHDPGLTSPTSDFFLHQLWNRTSGDELRMCWQATSLFYPIISIRLQRAAGGVRRPTSQQYPPQPATCPVQSSAAAFRRLLELQSATPPASHLVDCDFITRILYKDVY